MEKYPDHHELIRAYDELVRPSQVFNHPSDVVNDPDLSLNEKRAILAAWASDASAVEAAPALRMSPTGRVVQFDDIMIALRTLDKERLPRNLFAGNPPSIFPNGHDADSAETAATARRFIDVGPSMRFRSFVMQKIGRASRYVIGRENNVVLVDFREPDPPKPKFPGAGALRGGREVGALCYRALNGHALDRPLLAS